MCKPDETTPAEIAKGVLHMCTCLSSDPSTMQTDSIGPNLNSCTPRQRTTTF